MLKTIFSLLLVTSTAFSAIEDQTPTWQLKNSKVFSKLVGSWEGTWYKMDISGNIMEQFTSTLVQEIDEVNNKWSQTNIYHDSNEVKHFEGSVEGPSQVRFESVGGGHSDYETIATEHDDYHIFWVVKYKPNNRVIYTETISLTTEDERTRIGQRYSFLDGSFQGITLIHENRSKK